MKLLNLNKIPFSGAKIAVNSGKLLGSEKILSFVDLSFDEILRYLEEHGFRKSVDSSYIQFEGFYLIERILNIHISRIYTRVFRSLSSSNKTFLEIFYLKYQIHNLMVVVRAFVSSEKEIEPFLIGDERRKEKYLKAVNMPSVEDAITYLCKKIGAPSDKALDVFKSCDVFGLENFLYKFYFEKISSLKFKYNYIEERRFFEYLKKYIDLLNIRSFLKLKLEFENDSKLKIDDFFIIGGKLSLSYFNQIQSLKIDKCLDKFSELNFGKFESVSDIDLKISDLKKENSKIFKISGFTSPFFILKYLFDVELELNKLRILLKAKHMGIEKEEILILLGGKK